MDKVAETWITAPKRPSSPATRDACLVHIYPTGPWMGMRHTLSDKPLIVGRGEDCDIRVLDTSVSRRHVRIEKIGDDFYVLDMQSTNGTYVNDKQSLPGDPIPMRDGDYLRVGNCIFRYLASGNVDDQHEPSVSCGHNHVIAIRSENWLPCIVGHRCRLKFSLVQLTNNVLANPVGLGWKRLHEIRK